MRPAIDARDLFRVHSTPEGDAVALQGLSLSVHERELVTILGPSGSGKTSLLRIVAALDRPSAGTVHVFGENLAKLRRRALARYRASTLGYVLQDYAAALTPELTARELVALKLRLLGVAERARNRRADELLDRVGLREIGSARPAELAGGEQQRLAVCAAVAHRPRLLLADEPTGELDAASARLVYAVIAELARAEGCTAVVVSHDPASATIADRIVRVRDGRVSEEATRATPDCEAIVVARGGWVRLPDELLDNAGIRSRAVAQIHGRRIVITAAAEPAPAATDRRISGDREPTRADYDGTTVRAVDLTKTYGRGPTKIRVLDALEATFLPRRFHVVTGPSGSGKTTLLHVLAGLELPTSGFVDVGEQRVSELDREARAELRRTQLALVGQQSGLVPFLSARENVQLALGIRGEALDPVRSEEALAHVGLSGRSEQRVPRLSSGEQQRVAVARAIAGRPAVLIADEPSARVDRENAFAIAMLFRRFAENGMTVICATHDAVVIEQADDELPLVPRKAR